MLEELDLRLLNVCIPRLDKTWRKDKAIYRGLAQKHPRRYAWIGGFDPPATDDFARPSSWVRRAVRQVRQDLAAGAVGIKVWKSIGMEVRRPDGGYPMIDDPLFEPVLGAIEEAGATLLAHIGEPRACWRPLDEESPHAAYYARHPEWHMAGRTGFPSHEELIAARDRVVERHPRLRVVGAHLGSLEYDVGEVAARLDKYPNFAVDTSSRLLDLALQDRGEVRAFFRRYRQRILFGTDIVRPRRSSRLPAAERRQVIAASRERWQAELAFFATGEMLTLRGREVRGLDLGQELADELCIANPRRWYPGLAAG